jgi:hypothetical protein
MVEVGVVTVPDTVTTIEITEGLEAGGLLALAEVTADAPVSTTGVEGSGSIEDVTVPNASFEPMGVEAVGTVEEVVIPNVSFVPEGAEGLGEIGDPSVTTT